MKKYIFTICVISTLTFSAFAETDDVNLPVPIDGGISILLASGVAYGVKKIADSHKNDK